MAYVEAKKEVRRSIVTAKVWLVMSYITDYEDTKDRRPSVNSPSENDEGCERVCLH